MAGNVLPRCIQRMWLQSSYTPLLMPKAQVCLSCSDSYKWQAVATPGTATRWRYLFHSLFER